MKNCQYCTINSASTIDTSNEDYFIDNTWISSVQCIVIEFFLLIPHTSEDTRSLNFRFMIHSFCLTTYRNLVLFGH